MASTNKTTHYELSQYVGSDKPTYLGDYNGDMQKIDTAINSAQTKADTADVAAATAQSTAENAQTTANTAITNAGNAQTAATAVDTKVGDLANLTTTDKSSIVSGINEVNNKIGSAVNNVNNVITYLGIEPQFYQANSQSGNVSITVNTTVDSLVEIHGSISNWGYAGGVWVGSITHNGTGVTTLCEMQGIGAGQDSEYETIPVYYAFRVPANKTVTFTTSESNAGTTTKSDMGIKVTPYKYQ